MVLRRLLFSIAVLLSVSFVLFVLTRAMPVSPAVVVLGEDAPADLLTAFEVQHGLDKPLLQQYSRWLSGIARGDFGTSFVTGLPLAEEIKRTLPMTLEIVVLAFLLAVGLAVPLGIVSALRSNTAVDHIARLFAVFAVSIPGFWLGLVLIVYVAVGLGMFPPGGIVPWSSGMGLHLGSLVLPVIALGMHYVAILSRLTRSSLLDAMSQDYVRTARAMGISRPRILVYALRNALAPVVSIAATSFGYMFGWALIIEYVFNIPGMSRSLLTAISRRDYYTVQAVVLVITAIFILANLIADLTNQWLNPKTRTMP